MFTFVASRVALMQNPGLPILFLTFIILSAGFISCRKTEKTDTDPGLKLAFSTDTVFFDTVFPTVGSVTDRLIVYNRNKNKLRISSIRLAGGQSSNYRINIDGEPATGASDVEIAGNDSLYIFVKVTIDPQNQSTPYVVSDSIEFSTNGNIQRVRLVAWGREAIFYRSARLKGNIVWDSLMAHVIYGSVRVDTNATLTIMPGTKVYFHKDAYMAVSWRSTLKIAGTLEHPVRFQGDRMDPFYKDLPGQWGGIYLEQGSRDHELNYAYIKNGMFGISADSLGSQGLPMLSISNCIIQNMSSVGIYAYGTSITSVNCVIGDCGRTSVEINYGGTYSFKHLTVGNYWFSSVRHGSAVYLSNYSYDPTGAKKSNPLAQAYFGNVIIYGANDDEIRLDSVTSAQFTYTFDHAILKTRLKTSDQSRFISCLVNKDPEFVDISTLNYQIDSISPAIKMGLPMGVQLDIRGFDRGTTPALGAYEYVKTQ